MTTLTLADSSDRVRFTLIQAGLDRISQGFTVVDRELRLVGWNRTFFDLLDFPLEMARVGTPFADFMRYNAVRGEYGAGDVEELVKQRVEIARLFRPHQFERVRPSGRIMSVRGEPLPEGGFVTIYTDVTERLLFERLIREQNELLEARVRERTTELEASNAQLRGLHEEQKRAEAALVRAQKMEAVGKLSGGLAHDFNNLLTIIIGNLAALEESDQANVVEHVAPALGAARRGADLIQRLLAFAREKPLEPVIVDVAGALRSLLPLVRRSVPESVEIDLPTEAPEPLLTRVDPNELDSAFLNLVLNARDAMPGGGRLSIACALRHLSQEATAELGCTAGPYVCVSIRDTGIGMSSDTLVRAFEPFFTKKEFGRSSGLGLSMVYGFAHRSNGGIRLSSVPGHGTLAELFLPRVSTGVQRRHAENVAAPRASTGPHLVLLVEDEIEVRRVVRRQLRALGHHVVEAGTAGEALRLLEQTPEISVVLSDVVIPGGISGLDLGNMTRAKRADVRIVLMTGYADTLTDKLGAKLDWPLLNKPFSTPDLARALDAKESE